MLAKNVVVHICKHVLKFIIKHFCTVAVYSTLD